MSDIVNRLRFDFRDRDADEVEEMSQEIERLRADLAQRTAERDDARTLFCMNHPLVVSGDNEARDVARRHGWNCFDAHANTTDVPVRNGGEP
jgi:hypothetical protein